MDCLKLTKKKHQIACTKTCEASTLNFCVYLKRINLSDTWMTL